MNPNVMLKWGIVTAGKSSRNFAIAIKNLPKSKHELLAIVSQDKVRVNLFADEFDIQIRYTKYEDLANDQNVDVVYIGSLHPQHFETAKLMLLHRKHVVCEKPLCSNAMLTQSLITVAQNQNKFLMECMYCRCLPIYDEIKKIIQENLLGYTLYAYTCLGRKLNHLDRLLFPELGGSAILDLGVQCLQFLQFVFEEIHPHTIKAIGHFNHWRSDESVSAVLNYPGGKSGIITVHTCAKFPNEALVIGTDGCIKVSRFTKNKNCKNSCSGPLI